MGKVSAIVLLYFMPITALATAWSAEYSSAKECFFSLREADSQGLNPGITLTQENEKSHFLVAKKAKDGGFFLFDYSPSSIHLFRATSAVLKKAQSGSDPNRFWLNLVGERGVSSLWIEFHAHSAPDGKPIVLPMEKRPALRVNGKILKESSAKNPLKAAFRQWQRAIEKNGKKTASDACNLFFRP